MHNDSNANGELDSGPTLEGGPKAPTQRRRIATASGLVIVSTLCSLMMFEAAQGDAFGLPIGPVSYLFRIVIFCFAAILFLSLEAKPAHPVTLVRAVVFGVLWVFLFEVVSIGTHFAIIGLGSH